MKEAKNAIDRDHVEVNEKRTEARIPSSSLATTYMDNTLLGLMHKIILH